MPFVERSEVLEEEHLRKRKRVESPDVEEVRNSQVAVNLFDLGIGRFMQESSMEFQSLKSLAAVKCETLKPPIQSIQATGVEVMLLVYFYSFILFLSIFQLLFQIDSRCIVLQFLAIKVYNCNLKMIRCVLQAHIQFSQTQLEEELNDMLCSQALDEVEAKLHLKDTFQPRTVLDFDDDAANEDNTEDANEGVKDVTKSEGKFYKPLHILFDVYVYYETLYRASKSEL